MIWTDEQLSILNEEWPKGMSAKAIAIMIGDGITRSAVLGKAHRLGLKHPKRRGDKPRTTPFRAQRRASRPPTYIPPKLEPVVSITYTTILDDLRNGQCRFTASDHSPFLFCDAEAELGYSWCMFHKRIVFGAYVPTAAPATSPVLSPDMSGSPGPSGA